MSQSVLKDVYKHFCKRWQQANIPIDGLSEKEFVDAYR
jgi:hypothetical protein